MNFCSLDCFKCTVWTGTIEHEQHVGFLLSFGHTYLKRTQGYTVARNIVLTDIQSCVCLHVCVCVMGGDLGPEICFYR